MMGEPNLWCFLFEPPRSKKSRKCDSRWWHEAGRGIKSEPWQSHSVLWPRVACRAVYHGRLPWLCPKLKLRHSHFVDTSGCIVNFCGHKSLSSSRPHSMEKWVAHPLFSCLLMNGWMHGFGSWFGPVWNNQNQASPGWDLLNYCGKSLFNSDRFENMVKAEVWNASQNVVSYYYRRCVYIIVSPRYNPLFSEVRGWVVWAATKLESIHPAVL